jgi:hypothetical protein
MAFNGNSSGSSSGGSGRGSRKGSSSSSGSSSSCLVSVPSLTQKSKQQPQPTDERKSGARAGRPAAVQVAASGQGVAGSAQAAGAGSSLPVSPLSSRLFELLGVDLAAMQLVASQVSPASEGVFVVAHAVKFIKGVMFNVKVSCITLCLRN